MKGLMDFYIQEAKEGIEIGDETINLVNKKESELILKKHNISNVDFAKLIKASLDHYEANISGKKVSDFITDLENIKAKFPEKKYIQDITVRSYICHVIEGNNELIQNFFSGSEKEKQAIIADLSLNIGIVQVKKIYKINALKFAKILNKKETNAITTTDVKETKKALEAQIKTDVNEILPDEIKELVIAKNETIKPIDLKNIKQEIAKTEIKIDETAVQNVNKYLFAISETFNFLKQIISTITLKDIEKSEKMIKKLYDEELKKPEIERVFINKIKDILMSLGHINSFAMKENYENMNILAWAYNVLNLKAYHTGTSDFDRIDKEVEKKVVSVLHRYQPAQRNSYDAYHLVEDFIQICRDQTGEIKVSHDITDLMLTQILKSYMQKAIDDVNNVLRVSTKMNKGKVIEVKKDEQGMVTQIVNPEKTEKTRRAEVENIIGELSKDVSKARKFFFDLYNGQTTFNNKTWNMLDTKIQNQILKSAKLNRNSAEFLELKLNRNISKITGINPLEREAQSAVDSEEKKIKKIRESMHPKAVIFIDKFKENKESDIRDKYKGKTDLMWQIMHNYETTGNINDKVLEIFNKDEEFKFKLIDFARIIPPNGNITGLLSKSATPLLNRYIGMKDANK